MQDRIRLGHDRHLGARRHVVGDQVGVATTRAEALFPLLLGLELQEGIDPLIHPGPLAFIGIHRHREIDVADFVDDDTDQATLGQQRIAQIAVIIDHGTTIGPAIEGDHRVFHPALGTGDRLRDRIGIGEGKRVVDVQRVLHGAGGEGRPERLALIGIEGHRHDEIGRLAHPVLLDTDRIPDEFARPGPGEITDILGPEFPGRHGTGAATLIGARFRRGDDEDRFVSRASLFQTLALRLGQDFFRVLQNARRRDDEVLRHADGHVIIAKFKREFAASEEGLVVPAFIVREDRGTREPLRDLVDAVSAGILAFLETLPAGPATHDAGFDEAVIPLDGEGDAVAGLQILIQVETQEGVDNGEVHRLAIGVGDTGDVEAVTILLEHLATTQRAGRNPFRHRLANASGRAPATANGFGHRGDGIGAEAVLVEQEPQKIKRIRGVVGVGNRFGAEEMPGFLVEPDIDVVIDLLLPVIRSRRARGAAFAVRRRPVLVLELPEGIAPVIDGLLDRLGDRDIESRGRRSQSNHLKCTHVPRDPCCGTLFGDLARGLGEVTPAFPHCHDA